MEGNEKSCCAPARPSESASAGGLLRQAPTSTDLSFQENLKASAVRIPGGPALLGTDKPVIAVDGEGPCRKARIKPFLMSKTATTNAEFAEFVAQTGFVTEAERFGWSFVFWSELPDGAQDTQAVAGLEWWCNVPGAYWKAPRGPGTEEFAKPHHPVVHISWNDAKAYARWAGGRLASEAEWEHAARGGLGDVRYPWGDADPNDKDIFPCNIWQGRFPDRNLVLDGFASTAPARSFEPNGYGLYNLVGNVWEWTSAPFKIASQRRETKERLKAMRGYKLAKGGSYLCHASYCHRYRIAARMGNSPDSTTTHQGVRLAFDV